MNQGNSPRRHFASSIPTPSVRRPVMVAGQPAASEGCVASRPSRKRASAGQHDRQVDVPGMPAGGSRSIRPPQQFDRVGPLQRRIGVGNIWPISPRPAAPDRAQQTCATMSASLFPASHARPRSGPHRGSTSGRGRRCGRGRRRPDRHGTVAMRGYQSELSPNRSSAI